MSEILEVKNVAKIFGPNKSEAMKLMNKGLSKDEILKVTGATVALNNVSFKVNPGEIFVIIGLSGSGKSTIVRCLNMLQTPTSGEVFYNGVNLAKLKRKQIQEFRRKKTAMVFQSFGLLSHRNVLANVAFGLEVKGIKKEIREQKAKEMLELVGLSGWENSKISSLSGGMKQRVGIARALCNDPEILLMDEPFSALDPLVRREMQFELLTIQRKLEKTIVFITHDINEAFKLGDRIAIMKDGKIIQIDTPEKMISAPNDDYVRDFIDSADKTKVMTAKNIMITPVALLRPTDHGRRALKVMNENNFSSAFVVDEKMNFLGIITLEDAIQATKEDINIEKYILKDVWRTALDTPVSELVPLFNGSKYPIAVTNEQGKLKGIVSKAAVLSAIIL
ncbi:MAG TPA: glycine betaine/L-proline ABC transporter ATP-binding protein [Acholeplasmataceae bacterium]|nr:glycine betaine/L-proline ABC transporter ATP-binding protein [Acholeplasmataceae bacterium]